MSFSQAVSGLNAASTNLNVIGNNIANSETTGFKSASVSFADVFASSKVGLGVTVAAVSQNFNDGTVNTTDNGLNVAISNNGFFRLTDDSGAVYYSRNGDFKLDDNRNLVTSTGLNVTGYTASGTPPTIQQGTDPVNLSIPTTGLAAKATTTSTMVLKLNSDSDTLDDAAFDPDDSATYSFSQPLTTYDSLGNPHNISLYFVKSADNTWQVHSVDGSDSTGTVTDLGTLSFNSNGVLTGTDNFDVDMAGVNGSAANTFNLSFTGSQQQYTTASSVSSQIQDGYSAGDLSSYEIADDGTITGTYSNGKTQLLGQIILANFANPQGLQSAGDNVWTATSASGQAIVGTAGTGTFGTLTSGALESSNVDLSKELVNLIVAQRDYQSNAQTIKAQDTIMQTLVNLS
ncbi:flagellar hook protein FlgE [Acerihabitans arboris]|uniref:Flagellar hook protein FlgE n=1 Tax=Acerihabitans arboris TaxID=2691583 RepID=A0A845SCW9_9GAMM|nr:flagellar hook protein FlgE [Acerihabitans arboris]NDL62620.1 flagellar hook-basal body complex protein [Acerihabitans arboris]